MCGLLLFVVVWRCLFMVVLVCRCLCVASFRCSSFVVCCWSLVGGGGCLFVCVVVCGCVVVFLKLLRLVVI